MSEDAPTTLEDYRVKAGIGRVILHTASRREDGRVELLNVGMTTAEARKIAMDLMARIECVLHERARRTDGEDAVDVPVRHVSRELFEAELVAIRNGAYIRRIESVVRERERRPSIEGDHHAVEHAAEIALAVLTPGMRPKDDAMEDVRAMLAWYDGESDDWIKRD